MEERDKRPEDGMQWEEQKKTPQVMNASDTHDRLSPKVLRQVYL